MSTAPAPRLAATPEPVAPFIAPESSISSAPVADAPVQERRRAEELQFVYLRDRDNTTMSGSSADVRQARRLQRDDEPLLWFRRDGREYVVRDRDVLRDVERLWDEVGRIGAEQGRIGGEQGKIGAEQGKHGARLGAIGAEQGVIGARQGLVGARLGLLSAREAQGASAAQMREIERERETLDREMRELGREMEVLKRRMREVEPPRDLSREMETLGRQMNSLGRRMEEASRRAHSEMRSLMDRAIRSGAAERVR